MAQYSLNLSDELYKELQGLAKANDKTVKELMISLIKTGLIALDANNDINKELLFRETVDSGQVIEKQIILV